MLSKTTEAVVEKTENGIVSTWNYNDSDWEAMVSQNDGVIGEYMRTMAKAVELRHQIEQELLNYAIKECPYAPGEKIALKKPFRKFEEGVIEAVASGIYDPYSMKPEGKWTVVVRFNKNDGTPSQVTAFVEEDDIKGRVHA